MGTEFQDLTGIAQAYSVCHQADSAQAYLASIVESSDDSIIGSDMMGKIRSWNSGAQKMFGYTRDEVIGQPVTILFPENQESSHLQNVLGRARQLETIKRFEAVRVAKGGISIDVSVILSPIRDEAGNLLGLSGIYRDIRDRKQAEAERQTIEIQLRHAQKLQSVGQLAAGVAHEINTPVQFVSDSVYFARDGIKAVFDLLEEYGKLRQSAARYPELAAKAAEIDRMADEADLSYLVQEMPRALDRALEGLDRVAVIVRSMKEFAHPDQTEKTAVDLNRSITSTITVARNEYKYVAELESDLGELPPVLCHAGEINQVILNLIVNASHAIEDVVAGSDKKGVIRVRTWCDGNDAVIAVEDTGGGIPEAIQDRIFDPFFTTKGVGRGTGQGLAIARSVIVEKHGGSIEFETKAGQGTVFLIRLPIVGPRSEQKEPA